MPSWKVLPANANLTDTSPNMLKSMRIPHIIGSCIGLLPVRGITSNSPQSLRFSWISLNTAYTLCYFTIGVYSLGPPLKLWYKSSERIMHFCNNKASLYKELPVYINVSLQLQWSCKCFISWLL